MSSDDDDFGDSDASFELDSGGSSDEGSDQVDLENQVRIDAWKECIDASFSSVLCFITS